MSEGDTFLHMVLNDQQYHEIMRSYERIRDANRQELERRLEEVYTKIPEYRELELSLRQDSLARLHSLLNDDSSALSDMHEEVTHTFQRKKELLASAGFPDNYLEPIYSCPDCKDTGYITRVGFPKEKCSCMKQKEIELLYEQSQVRKVISNENFDTLSYAYYQDEHLERFRKAVDICRNFIENFKQDYQNLFFYGTVGTGKSFLSGCIANELIQKGYYVIYFSSIGLFEKLAQLKFDYNEKDKLYDMLNDIYGCDLLIIDDLGTELTNAFVASQFFNCLNERHLRHKATIISTNLNLEELQNRYSDRVFSRITGNYTICKLTGPDIRLTKKMSQLHGDEKQ